MYRADQSGVALTEDDASIVKGMLMRGDRQHDIAAWFGVNGGRIAEISTGKKYINILAKEKDLPPPGPYSSGRELANAKAELLDIRKKAEEIITKVDHALNDL